MKRSVSMYKIKQKVEMMNNNNNTYDNNKGDSNHHWYYDSNNAKTLTNKMQEKRPSLSRE